MLAANAELGPCEAAHAYTAALAAGSEQSARHYALGQKLHAPAVKKLLALRVAAGALGGAPGGALGQETATVHVAVRESALEALALDGATGALVPLHVQPCSARILDADVLPVDAIPRPSGAPELAARQFPDVLAVLTEDGQLSLVVYVGGALAAGDAPFDALASRFGLLVPADDRRRGYFATVLRVRAAPLDALEGDGACYRPVRVCADRGGRALVLVSYRSLGVLRVPAAAAHDLGALSSVEPIVLPVGDLLWDAAVLPTAAAAPWIVRIAALSFRNDQLALSVFEHDQQSALPIVKRSFSWLFEANAPPPLFLLALPEVPDQFLIVSTKDLKIAQLSHDARGHVRGGHILRAAFPGGLANGSDATTDNAAGGESVASNGAGGVSAASAGLAPGANGEETSSSALGHQGYVTACAFPARAPSAARTVLDGRRTASNTALQQMFYTTEAGQLYRLDILRDDVKFTFLGQRSPTRVLVVLASQRDALTGDCASAEGSAATTPDASLLLGASGLLTDDEWHLLALYGDGCDGEVVLVDGAQGALVRRCRLKNWGPATMLARAPAAALGVAAAPETAADEARPPTVDNVAARFAARDLLFVCSNVGRHGSIKRLEQGVAATVLSTTAASEMGDTTGMYEMLLPGPVAVLCLSVAGQTRLLALGAGGAALEDVSEDMPVDVGAATLAAGNLVGPGQVIVACHVSPLRIAAFWGPLGSPGALQVMAEHCLEVEAALALATLDGQRVLAVRAHDPRVVVAFEIQDNGSWAERVIAAFSSEVTAVAAVDLGRGRSAIAVGTRAATLTLLDPAGPSENNMLGIWSLQGQKSSQVGADAADRCVHAVGTVAARGLDGDVRAAYLVAGLRGGCVAFWEIGRLGTALLGDQREVELGTRPVGVVGDDGTRGYAVLVGESAWRAHAGRLGIELEPVLLTDASCVAPYSFRGDSADEFAVVDNGCLKLVQLEPRPRCNLKSLPVCNTPRHVLYDAASGKLIVAVTYLRHDPTSGLERPLRRTEIKVVDAASGKTHAKETLKLDETATAMCLWDIKPGKRYLCIGTDGHLDRTHPMRDEKSVRGRVVVFNLKTVARASDGADGAQSPPLEAVTFAGGGPQSPTTASRKLVFRIRQLGDLHLAHPVAALCAYHHSYLLAGAGAQLCLLKIDASRRELVLGTFTHVRGLITSVEVAPGPAPGSSDTSANGRSARSSSASNNTSDIPPAAPPVPKSLLATNFKFQHIVVGTQADGVCVLKYDYETKALRLLGSETLARPIAAARQYNPAVWPRAAFAGPRAPPRENDWAAQLALVRTKAVDAAAVLVASDRLGGLRVVRPAPPGMVNERMRFLNLEQLADCHLAEPVVHLMEARLRPLPAGSLFAAHAAAAILPDPWADAFSWLADRESLRAVPPPGVSVLYGAGVLGGLYTLFPLRDQTAWEQLALLEYAVLEQWQRIELQLAAAAPSAPAAHWLAASRPAVVTAPPLADTFAPAPAASALPAVVAPFPTLAERLGCPHLAWFLSSRRAVHLGVLELLLVPPLCLRLDAVAATWLFHYERDRPDACSAFLASVGVSGGGVPSADVYTAVVKRLLTFVDALLRVG